MKKAEYARMHGWDRSYVSKLQREGRIVLSVDGTLVDWAATDALIGKTADPSKIGVKQRWADERAARDVGDVAAGQGLERGDSPAAPAAGQSAVTAPAENSSFQAARASREHYNGQMARLEYEWLTGLLVSKPRVEDAAHTIGRAVRDRVLGLAPRIAPELAAISDPWELERRLTAALRQVLDDVASFGASAMRGVFNDPSRGRISELTREGKERYGHNRDNPAAP